MGDIEQIDIPLPVDVNWDDHPGVFYLVSGWDERPHGLPECSGGGAWITGDQFYHYVHSRGLVPIEAEYLAVRLGMIADSEPDDRAVWMCAAVLSRELFRDIYADDVLVRDGDDRVAIGFSPGLVARALMVAVDGDEDGMRENLAEPLADFFNPSVIAFAQLHRALQ